MLIKFEMHICTTFIRSISAEQMSEQAIFKNIGKVRIEKPGTGTFSTITDMVLIENDNAQPVLA